MSDASAEEERKKVDLLKEAITGAIEILRKRPRVHALGYACRDYALAEQLDNTLRKVLT